MKKTHPFLSALSLLSLSTALLIAEETSQEPQPEITQENVEIGSRPLQQDKRELMDQQRKLEAQEQERAQHASAGQTAPIMKLANPQTKQNFMLASSVSYFPIDFHWVDSFPAYNMIKLEDGSEWTVISSESATIRSWRTGDALFLSPNTGWFASSPYYLTNSTLNSYVQVTPFLGPEAFGPYTHWIVGMDFNQNHVYMTNGKGERTTWKISGSNSYLFKDWQINDTIIIGINKTWLSSYDHILLNVPMNHYVHAKQP